MRKIKIILFLIMFIFLSGCELKIPDDPSGVERPIDPPIVEIGNVFNIEIYDDEFITGENVISSFYQRTVVDNKEATLNIKKTITLDEAECSQEYYEEHKDEYPKEVNIIVVYDGTIFKYNIDSNSLVSSYKYLKYERIIGNNEGTDIAYRDEYYLVNDETITYSKYIESVTTSLGTNNLDYKQLFSKDYKKDIVFSNSELLSMEFIDENLIKHNIDYSDNLTINNSPYHFIKYFDSLHWEKAYNEFGNYEEDLINSNEKDFTFIVNTKRKLINNKNSLLVSNLNTNIELTYKVDIENGIVLLTYSSLTSNMHMLYAKFDTSEFYNLLNELNIKFPEIQITYSLVLANQGYYTYYEGAFTGANIKLKYINNYDGTIEYVQLTEEMIETDLSKLTLGINYIKVKYKESVLSFKIWIASREELYCDDDEHTWDEGTIVMIVPGGVEEIKYECTKCGKEKIETHELQIMYKLTIEDNLGYLVNELKDKYYYDEVVELTIKSDNNKDIWLLVNGELLTWNLIDEDNNYTYIFKMPEKDSIVHIDIAQKVNYYADNIVYPYIYTEDIDIPNQVVSTVSAIVTLKNCCSYYTIEFNNDSGTKAQLIPSSISNDFFNDLNWNAHKFNNYPEGLMEDLCENGLVYTYGWNHIISDYIYYIIFLNNQIYWIKVLQTEDLSKEYTISLLTVGSYVIQKLTEPYQKVSYNGSNCVKEIPEIGSNFTIGEKRYMLITNYNSLSKLLSEHFNEKITSLITDEKQFEDYVIVLVARYDGVIYSYKYTNIEFNDNEISLVEEPLGNYGIIITQPAFNFKYDFVLVPKSDFPTNETIK